MLVRLSATSAKVAIMVVIYKYVSAYSLAKSMASQGLNILSLHSDGSALFQCYLSAWKSIQNA